MDCPICKLPKKDVATHAVGDRFEVTCARCGRFDISGTANAIANGRPADFRLSAWIRSQLGVIEPPMITSATLDDVAKGLPTYRVSEKQVLFLRALKRGSDFAGKKVHIVPEFDFPLAACASARELEYVIRALMGRDLVSLDQYTDPKDSFSLELTITPRGWTHLDESAKPAQFSNQAFVAMAFAEELRPAWTQGIEPALRSVGYLPYRVDAQPHMDRVDVKIMAEIKNSRFVVADVTRQRPGVYFEAGYAIGLGLPVFWCVREDDLANVHFDTRQYNHIVWKSEEHLRQELSSFVLAIVGRGTAA